MKHPYVTTDSFEVAFEDVACGGVNLLTVHCTVTEWSPTTKKELKALLRETLEEMGGQPMFAFSDNQKLSKFISLMGGRELSKAVTRGLGPADVYVFDLIEQEANHG